MTDELGYLRSRAAFNNALVTACWKAVITSPPYADLDPRTRLYLEAVLRRRMVDQRGLEGLHAVFLLGGLDAIRALANASIAEAPLPLPEP